MLWELERSTDVAISRSKECEEECEEVQQPIIANGCLWMCGRESGLVQ